MDEQIACDGCGMELFETELCSCAECESYLCIQCATERQTKRDDDWECPVCIHLNCLEDDDGE